MEYDIYQQGRLTLDAMKAIIASGESVTIGRRVISRLEDLPTPAEYSKFNPGSEAGLRTALQAQLSELQAQLTALNSEGSSESTEPTPAPPVPGKDVLPPGDQEGLTDSLTPEERNALVDNAVKLQQAQRVVAEDSAAVAAANAERAKAKK